MKFHAIPLFLITVGPPLLLPIYFHLEVLFYVIKKKKWIVCYRIPLVHSSLYSRSSAGFFLHDCILYVIPFDIRQSSGWILAQFPILFLPKVRPIYIALLNLSVYSTSLLKCSILAR